MMKGEIAPLDPSTFVSKGVLEKELPSDVSINEDNNNGESQIMKKYRTKQDFDATKVENINNF